MLADSYPAENASKGWRASFQAKFDTDEGTRTGFLNAVLEHERLTNDGVFGQGRKRKFAKDRRGRGKGVRGGVASKRVLGALVLVGLWLGCPLFIPGSAAQCEQSRVGEQ